MSRKRQGRGISKFKVVGIAQRKSGNDREKIFQSRLMSYSEFFCTKKGRDGFPGPLLSYFTECQLFSFT